MRRRGKGSEMDPEARGKVEARAALQAARTWETFPGVTRGASTPGY